MREKDRERFVYLANKRVNSALKALSLIGNLSNRSNYDYTDADVAKIFKALNDGVADAKRRFDVTLKTKGEELFFLE